jgi:threonine dehydrogenase-like Zn-dependent dehydrogenase
VETREDRHIQARADAILRLSRTCICGSDLWPWRGIDQVTGPSPMGHEYAGIVEEVGSKVGNVKPGQFVVGSFFASDNTCEICKAGYRSSCINRVGIGEQGPRPKCFASHLPTARSSLRPMFRQRT